MRRNQKKLRRQLENKPITITQKERDKMQLKATEDAVQIIGAFDVWVLHNQGWGEKRLRRFMEERDDLLDSYNKKFVTLPDIARQLYKETGIRIGEENTE